MVKLCLSRTRARHRDREQVISTRQLARFHSSCESAPFLLAAAATTICVRVFQGPTVDVIERRPNLPRQIHTLIDRSFLRPTMFRHWRPVGDKKEISGNLNGQLSFARTAAEAISSRQDIINQPRRLLSSESHAVLRMRTRLPDWQCRAMAQRNCHRALWTSIRRLQTPTLQFNSAAAKWSNRAKAKSQPVASIST